MVPQLLHVEASMMDFDGECDLSRDLILALPLSNNMGMFKCETLFLERIDIYERFDEWLVIQSLIAKRVKIEYSFEHDIFCCQGFC